MQKATLPGQRGAAQNQNVNGRAAGGEGESRRGGPEEEGSIGAKKRQQNQPGRAGPVELNLDWDALERFKRTRAMQLEVPRRNRNNKGSHGNFRHSSTCRSPGVSVPPLAAQKAPRSGSYVADKCVLLPPTT